MAKRPFVLKTMLAAGVCKLSRNILRKINRGGTALPGKLAMKIDRNILETVSEGMEIIIVTGTNGKTTTARMLEHALTSSGRQVLANKSGANLLSGVTAEFTVNTTASGKPKYHYAVIECDEGALKQVVPLCHPRAIVVTNLFRDQLDRYGEVTHILEQVRKGVEAAPEAVLCLNADCSLTSSLALQVPNRVVYFGMDTPLGEQKESEISDATHCIRCGSKYEYEYHTYAHLGGFVCPHCGYRRQEPQVAVQEICALEADRSIVKMRIRTGNREESRETVIGLPAVYNIYNAAAAAAGFLAAGFDWEAILRSLGDVTSSFGRMESFELHGKKIRMILVKNPAGCNQAVDYVEALREDCTLVLCLNDRIADGTDISWIWDVDYEKIGTDEHIREVILGGDRAEDLQIRMKNAGISEEHMHIQRDYRELVRELDAGNRPVFILPNYTSMMELRKILGEATGKEGFWKG